MSKILFLSMYPLAQLNSAQKVRSNFLYKELNRLEKTDLIEGDRRSRTIKLFSWAFKGGFFKIKVIYVESNTTVGSPLELLFLLLAKVFRKRIFIFIPDAYPLFLKEFPAESGKIKLLYFGWKLSYFLYKITAQKLFFPSKTFAKLFNLEESKIGILEPAGNIVYNNRSKIKLNHKIGYVGGLSSRYGIWLLSDSLNKVREKFPDVKCVTVAKVEQVGKFRKKKLSETLEFRSGSFNELEEILSDVSICVLPLLKTRYNKLTLPVKLFDYMALGKAIISTNLPEVAEIVGNEKVGIICEDTPKSLAGSIIYLFEHPDKIKEFRENSLKTVSERHSWKIRARQLQRAFR